MNALAELLLLESLQIARDAGASDVHFVPGRPPAFRIEGAIRFGDSAPVSEAALRDAIEAAFPAHLWQRFVRDGDASASSHALAGTVRLHAYATNTGPALAARLLPQAVPSLEELRLPKILHSFVNAIGGLAVVAGPTGSGKTTTLASLIDRINKTSARAIVTIEDPIEYVHESRLSVIQQREIGRHSDSFERALLGALRADPDVIVLGEIRSAEAIQIALRAAETGHLVLTTIHAPDAARAVARMVEAFPSDIQTQIRSELADVLIGVIAQRLVGVERGGRRCAAEVMVATDATRSLIRDGKLYQLRNAISMGRASGMQTLDEDLKRLGCDRTP